MNIKGVIFDLDGVIVSTDNYHYNAWKKLCNENGLVFNEEINNHLRGVSRKESLLIILRANDVSYSIDKINKLLEEKNDYYINSLSSLSSNDIMPGIKPLINFLKANNIKIAIGSSSSNAKRILNKIGLIDTFDIIVDGNDIDNSKPSPEIFLKAASKLKLKPTNCLVIEDAISGVDAALNAKMRVVGVGFASSYKNATYRYSDITDVTKLFIK